MNPQGNDPLWMQTVRGFVANQSPNTAAEDAQELKRQAKRADAYGRPGGIDALLGQLRQPNAAGNQRQLAAMSPVPGRRPLSPDELPPEAGGPAGGRIDGAEARAARGEAREERREAREERKEAKQTEQFKLENLQDLIRQLQRGGRAFGSLPTPGNITTLVVILVVFIFAIVPVNGGHTRLSLMWMALLGQVHVPQADENNQFKGDPGLAGWPSAAITNEAAQIWNTINPLKNVAVPPVLGPGGWGAGILGGGANLGR